jgi:hypothetical protein
VNAFFKPAKGTAKLEQFDRKEERRIEKAKAADALRRAAAKDWDLVKRHVYERDLGQCRVCRVALHFKTSNPYHQFHPHHIVYRSAGGTDQPENVCVVCVICHRAEHDHRISITGNANEALTISSFTFKPDGSRELIRTWHSTV